MKKLFALFLTSLILSSNVFAKDMRFVQVTDVRYSHASKNQILSKMINNINDEKDVEFVVFTGDNIERPKEADLVGFLKEVKKLNCPFYLVLGDKELNKRKSMGKTDYYKIIKKNYRKYKYLSPNYTFEKNGVVFIVVDGAKEVIPSSSGYYKDDTISWLDSELKKNTEKNVFIFQHFPIIPPAKRESYYTYKAENYLSMLMQHKNVKSIIAGHFGVNKEQKVNNVVHISTAPAPCYRVIDVLDYDTTNPTIWAQIKYSK